MDRQFTISILTPCITFLAASSITQWLDSARMLTGRAALIITGTCIILNCLSLRAAFKSRHPWALLARVLSVLVIAVSAYFFFIVATAGPYSLLRW